MNRQRTAKPTQAKPARTKPAPTLKRRALSVVSLLLAVICLCISGGMTLGHTDDVAPLLEFHTSRSLLAHSVTDGGPAVACLACQWEDTTFDPHLPAVPVLRPALTLMALPPCRVQTHTPHPFDHTSPRAPPRDFS